MKAYQLKADGTKGVIDIDMYEDLPTLQGLVDGYIDFIRLSSDLMLMVNEEGKEKNGEKLPFNWNASRFIEYIVGDAYIFHMTRDQEVPIDLNTNDLNFIQSMLNRRMKVSDLFLWMDAYCSHDTQVVVETELDGQQFKVCGLDLKEDHEDPRNLVMVIKIDTTADTERWDLDWQGGVDGGPVL